MAIRRALTLQNIVDAKIPKFPFTGEWYNAFGNPQSTGIWYIYGESGSGKTTFVLNLMKCLAQYTSGILLESHEEGEISVSLQDGIKRFGLLEIKKKIFVVDESLTDMIERLSAQKSPEVVLIDSVEHSEFRDAGQVIELRRKFPNKLFIFIGQASGLNPRSKLGESILFIANQKIWVEGYRAISRGRSFGPEKHLTLWDVEADKYWEKD